MVTSVTGFPYNHDGRLEDFDPAPVVERACLRKVPMGQRAAEAAAEKVRARGVTAVAAYACPFAVHVGNGAAHWHIGHVPGPEALERLAFALRAIIVINDLQHPPTQGQP